MKLCSRRPKAPSKVFESLNQQLSMYTRAASAAGVGMLALAPSATAKIVYTPAHMKIVQNGGLISFDLNHDGIPDFGLSNKYMATTSRAYGTLQVVQERQTNEIWGASIRGILCAAALPKGTQIGPKGQFQKDPASGLVMALASFDTYFGQWLKVKQAYLGLKFVITGKTHFGWARVKINIQGTSINATLTGYAYETIANKPIIAGKTKGPDVALEPASLGHLAQGASAVSAWRPKVGGNR